MRRAFTLGANMAWMPGLDGVWKVPSWGKTWSRQKSPNRLKEIPVEMWEPKQCEKVTQRGLHWQNQSRIKKVPRYRGYRDRCWGWGRVCLVKARLGEKDFCALWHMWGMGCHLIGDVVSESKRGQEGVHVSRQNRKAERRPHILKRDIWQSGYWRSVGKGLFNKWFWEDWLFLWKWNEMEFLSHIVVKLI